MPLSGSTKFAIGLVELGETFHLLDHWLILKRYNSGTARWNNAQDKERENGAQLL